MVLHVFSRILFVFFTMCVINNVSAGPVERFERLVMPGKLSSAHAKYEENCDSCHEPFEKGAQNDLCVDCHKETGKDIKDKRGLHGKIREITERKCSECHPDHLDRDANIVPFDRDTFNHLRTDFPLEGTHQRLSCSDCHGRGIKYRKASSDCVGCHKKDDVHRERMGKQCQNCHIENVWGEAHFNHDKTDFKLRDTHQLTGCSSCHANQRYKDTPTKCIACHRLDDVHKQTRGEKCDDCHKATGWGTITFDHDKDTKYPLSFRHKAVSCEACHGDDAYKKIDKACKTCHEKDDVHNQYFGDKCQDCHSEKSWSRMKFNHNKSTDYPLRGRHKKVDCALCHRADVFAELKTDCFACHRQDDMHNGEEGERCQQCHDESGWDGKVFFDHDLTAFPLLDSHAITPCEECHFTPEFKEAKTACIDCHQVDDDNIHKMRLGKNCAQCHNSNNWQKWQFDHNKQTDYKLDGAHSKLDCHACHKEKIVDEIKLGMTCIDCHKRDDHHNGAFGKECERCHLTSSFKHFKAVN